MSELAATFGVRQVAGVVAYSPDNSNKICIVSSSKKSNKWVLPKGGVESGEKKKIAAAREAWEEAGIKGEVGDKLGDWHIYTVNSEGLRAEHYTFYTLKVTKIYDDWPEKDGRRRKWVQADKALELVKWKYMKKAISKFEKNFIKDDYKTGYFW
ncbi:hypothetical protein CONCODRAFT_51362, partial [Conidiobolus coronatus NRRL 28638]